MTQLPLPPHSPTCMGCGPDNPAGLQLEVFRSGEEVYTDVTFDERHIGAPGLAHGGAVATACDDLFGFTLWIARTPAVTRNLTVDYLAPVPLHRPLRIRAHIREIDGRKLHLEATATADDGTALFTANAVFIAVSIEHFARHGTPGTAQQLFDRLTFALGDDGPEKSSTRPPDR
ncbi:PaaI family thioesterase [Rhodococcus sp. D-46]|nr:MULTISPECIES: PaaI family thioesterase [Rhodococcus]NHE69089.1 PaaI family thioesterase [Rhodococcus sp. D-46]EQM29769.1 thioesterase [Rhodococcus erythropolis DN1]MBF7737698.1 PaaI family thioesterase [Rhodococcus erythropolis]MBS2993556.1 PaaI family thioesterase [Rhodococcus erythropolis]MBW0282279.1 thioesterase [Rhodococcus sp. FH8]